MRIASSHPGLIMIGREELSVALLWNRVRCSHSTGRWLTAVVGATGWGERRGSHFPYNKVVNIHIRLARQGGNDICLLLLVLLQLSIMCQMDSSEPFTEAMLI